MHPYTLTLEEKLKQGGYNFQIQNHGISGETTDFMVSRFRRTSASDEFNIAVILGGTNDLGNRNPEGTFGNLKKMHDCAAEKGIRSIAVTIPEIGNESFVHWLAAVRQQTNNLIKAHCSINNIPLIDLATLLPYHSLSESERKNIWDDNLHFTKNGYDRFGEIVFTTLIEIMKP